MQRRTFVTGSAGLLALPAMQARAADSGVSDDQILFGHTGILSGPLGGQINVMLAGAELAFAEAARAGGVYGRRVRLRALDDELKPDTAVANVRRLLDTERVFAFFGNVGSATTAATAPLLKQAGVPSIAGYAVADSAREKAKGAAYFVRAAFGREAEALLQHLGTIGIKRIGLAVLDNPGGQEVQGLIAAALAKDGSKPTAGVAVKGDGSNVGQAARMLADTDPQAVLMYLGGALPGELMKAYWALGKSTSFYGMSIVAGEVTAKVAGERARGLGISQVVPYPWAQTDPLVVNYRQSAEQAKVPVGYYSFEGYINGLVLLEALRRAGRELTRPKLHAAMQGLKLRLAGMNIDFTGGGVTGSRFIDLVQVTQDGKFIR